MKKLSLILFILFLLALPALAFAQSPTEEATPEAVDPTAPVVNVDVETPSSDFSLPALIAVFVAGGTLVGAVLAFWAKSGGSVSTTLEAVVDSTEFTDLIDSVKDMIPREVHEKTVDALNTANNVALEASKTLAAFSTALDRITERLNKE